MKDISLLVWLTQLGLSVALPPAGFILLAVWLRDRFGWGSGVLGVGLGLGLVFAADGLRTSFMSMERMSKDTSQKEPPVSLNDHD